MRSRRRIIEFAVLAVALAAIAAGNAAPVCAGGESVVVDEIHVGWGGALRAGEWTPVSLALS